MDKLKPCPFCGGEAEYISFVDDNVQALLRRPACQIRCMNCKVIMGDFVAEDYSFSYKDKATEAWNRRHVWGKTKMPRLKIIEIRPEIRANVEANNGYCPCAIWQTEDTKCMCKDFREQKEPGECHCGRFEKVVTEDG